MSQLIIATDVKPGQANAGYNAIRYASQLITSTQVQDLEAGESVDAVR